MAGTAAESDGATRIAGSAKKLDLPPGIRCVLSVLSGPDSGKKMELDRPRVVVGRGMGDFPLTDRDVSEEHCAFEITGVACTVKDLGSKNGTFVEGQRISTHMLSNVGEVVVGNTTLLFTMTLDETLPTA
jgi:pSer/pThr/pTyr-binding forkhead associated (FHA) protein